MEWLKKQQPEIAFDPSELKTREDWIKAGEVVFNTPTSHSPVFFGAANLRDPSFYDELACRSQRTAQFRSRAG